MKPPNMKRSPEKTTKRVSLRVPLSLLDPLKARAAELGEPWMRWMLDVLKDAVDREDS